VHGQTIGGRTGESITDTLILWFYVDPEAKLTNIANMLLGTELR
jgi:hypothetical protein